MPRGRHPAVLSSQESLPAHAVLELVRASDCSAYDCEFVALAAQLDTRLVTMDKKLLRAFPARAVALAAR